MSSRTEMKKSVEKKFCGTCHKAGKSIEEYTSHFTRSSKAADAIVTCPLILATVCTYCRKTGHWKKFCPVLEKLPVEKKKKGGDVKKMESDIKKTVAVSTNRFDCLDLDVETKALVETKAKVENPNSWAAVLKREPTAKPVIACVVKPLEIFPIPLTENSKGFVAGSNNRALSKTMDLSKTQDLSKARKLDWASLVKNMEKKEVVVVSSELPFLKLPPALPSRPRYNKITNWADCESSDEEEEENEYYIECC